MRIHANSAWRLGAVSVLLGSASVVAQAASILFIGNSFTYAAGSAVHFYRSETVTDLNGQGIGGLPALFKSFTDQAGLSYEVSLETEGGVGLDWHLAHKRDLLAQRPWDMVVMHGYSTLDAQHPGDPTLLVRSVSDMAEFLARRQPAVDVRLLATWPRADQVYPPQGAWAGKPIEAMARDVRAGYDRAAAATPQVHGVVPVGDAWVRAMHEGVANANPYAGIAPGTLDLWTYDHYHASVAGTYLEALVVFGQITGRDPRSLGAGECSGYELGLSVSQVQALQRIAYEQLAAEPAWHRVGPGAAAATSPARCAAIRH